MKMNSGALPSARPRSLRSGRRRKWINGYIMLAPFLLLFIIFNVVPIFWSLGLSLTSYDIFRPMRFVGVTNYVNLFTNDDLFITAFKNTLLFAMVSGPLGFIASFLFAWIISQLRFRNAFSLAFYIPSIMSVLDISVVWLNLFSDDRYGIINNALLKLGLIDSPILWTSNPEYIMPLVVGISVWMSLGAGFLTNLAGLSNMNMELFEAGRIDGIRFRYQELIYITIPQIKPQLLFNAIMATVAAFGVYELPVSIAGFPSPDYAAHTIVTHMYDYGFIRLQLGYASAIAFVLFLLNFGLGQVFMKILGEKD